ncbi:MAG: HEAT repeat domain-containing protein [Phycisphaerae bacterium]
MAENRPRILEVLRDRKAEVADRAFVEALRYLDGPQLQTEIVEILLHRGRDEGLNAMPALFDHVDDQAQAIIVDHTPRLFAALRAGIRSGKVQTRFNTLRIVQRSRNPRLAYLPAHAMHDASPRIRMTAAAVLLELSNLFRRRQTETRATLQAQPERGETSTHSVAAAVDHLAQEQQFLATALREALSSFESHHQIEVVEAAMYLAEELEETLFDHPSSRRGKLTHAMQEVFTKSLSPRLASFAYIALRYRDLRGRVVSTLANCRDAAFFAEFVRYAWLGRSPSIGRALHSIHTLSWLSDELEAVFSLPPDVAVRLPAWLLPLGISTDLKVSILNHVFLLDNPAAHRAAAWALMAIRTAAGTRTLNVLLESDDVEVRSAARQELDHRKRHAIQKNDVPAGRPAAWRKLLSTAGLSETFSDLWDDFERIDPALARDAGFDAFTFVPGFATQVRVHLLGRKPQERLRALKLVLTLCVAEQFRKEIFGLAQDGDPSTRTATMTALGQIGDPTSRRILERALNDGTPSVEAAAIHGLDRIGADRRDELIKRKCNSEDARVRAAAVRALLRMRNPHGAANLIYMLNDPRPRHRAAALWITERLQLTTVADRIAEIADTDVDERVARTAIHVLKKFDRLRSQGAGRPATTGGIL